MCEYMSRGRGQCSRYPSTRRTQQTTKRLTKHYIQCHALASNPELKGRVVYPNSTIYEERIDSIWSWDAALTPWCIVLPASVQQTVAAIEIIDRVKCPFGIRSGGHGTFAGSNNVNDGVTIDFGNSLPHATENLETFSSN
jgi:hypothetical protein